MTGYNLSPGQKHAWKLQEELGAFFNNGMLVEIADSLDLARLHNAFIVNIKKHEALRTTFVKRTDTIYPLQVIHDSVPFEIRVLDYRNINEPEASSEMHAHVFKTLFKNVALALTADVFLLKEKSYLAIVMSAVACDQRTLISLTEGIFRAYDGAAEGGEDEVIQYSQYSEWQNDLRRDPNPEGSSFWNRVCEDAAPTRSLSVEENIFGDVTRRPEWLIRQLAPEVYSAIDRFASVNNVQVADVLLATWVLILWAYTGFCEEVTTTLVLDGRSNAAFHQIAGCLSRAVPLQMPMDETESSLHFIQAIADRVRMQQEWQDYYWPGDYVSSKQTGRCVSFEFNESSVFSSQANLKRGLMLSADEGCFLKLNCLKTSEGVSVGVIYDASVFSATAMEMIWQRFENTLGAIADNPVIGIKQLFVAKGNEARAYESLNAAPPVEDTASCFVDLFDLAVKRFPHKTALTYKTESLTYKEVGNRSNQLANCLRTKYAVAPGDVVAIRVQRSEAMVMALLGILKAGAIYLPLDSSLPLERVDFILQDAGVSILICDEKLSNSIREVQLSDLFFEAGAFSEAFMGPVISPNDGMYIVYTSGSTGAPKGVEIAHRSLVNYIRWFVSTFEISDNDATILLSSIAFDLGYTTFWSILAAGGTLNVLEETAHFDVSEFLRVAARSNVSAIKLTPSHFHLIMNYAETAQFLASCKLRLVVLGGEKLRHKDVEQFFRQRSDIRLVNHYGPTETTIGTLANIIDTRNVGWATRANIVGRPICNNRIYILNENLALVPAGVSGEIFVAGNGVAKGYWKHPELAKDKFVEGVAGENRGYRTGDIGRLLPSGVIEFLGRRDDQIKIRGYRVELNDIRNVALAHACITEVIVVLREDAENSAALVMYYTSTEAIDKDDIRAHLTKSLPDYMIPVSLVRLERFPLLANGKIDKRALPSPVEAQGAGTYIAPRNAMENRVINILQEILGKQNIGATDNFFQLGGDSIKAIQVSSKLYQDGFRIELKALFQNPTVEGISAQVKPVRKAHQGYVSGRVKLTPIQIQFFERKKLNWSHYNQSVLLDLKRDVPVHRIQEAFSYIANHHDILRAYYRHDGAEFVQYCPPESNEIAIEVFDFTENNSWAISLTDQCNELQQSLDIEKGLLMRLGFFKTPQGNKLLIIVHHLAIDAISWRYVLEDFNTLLKQFDANDALTLPAKTQSFQSWAEELYVFEGSQSINYEKDFWRSILEEGAGISILQRGDTPNYVKDYGEVAFQVSVEDTTRLFTNVNQAFGAEVNHVLLASVGCGFRNCFGVRKLLIDLEGHGREQITENVDVARTVGWFASIFPFVVDSGPTTPEEHIRKVRDDFYRIPNRGIGFGILKYIGGAEACKNTQASPVLYNYFGVVNETAGGEYFTFAGEDRGHSISPETQRDYAIEVSVVVSDGRLEFTFLYNSHKFTLQEVTKLKDETCRSLLQMIGRCAASEGEQPSSDFTYDKLTTRELGEIELLLGNAE